MNAGVAAAADPALVECYEALRNDGATLGGPTLCGRALLRFKGMAVWMQSVGTVTAVRTLPIAPRQALRLPVGIEQNLINIVATMTLATAAESQP